MKIILSPAKLMDIKSSINVTNVTEPIFIEKTKKLHEKLKKCSPKKLQNLMHISPKLAQENWERNQIWSENPAENEGLQAILAFKGEVFRGLQIESISEENHEYVTQNVRILSGLYGILQPWDFIMPYRLEMGTSFGIGTKKSLYETWKNDVTNYLNSMMEQDEILLNLASKEYSQAIDRKKLKSNLIDVDFKDEKNGKLQSIMVYFKHARGSMARFCIENSIQTLEEVKTYNKDNYLFSEELSTENHLVFIR